MKEENIPSTAKNFTELSLCTILFIVGAALFLGVLLLFMRVEFDFSFYIAGVVVGTLNLIALREFCRGILEENKHPIRILVSGVTKLSLLVLIVAWGMSATNVVLLSGIFGFFIILLITIFVAFLEVRKSSEKLG